MFKDMWRDGWLGKTLVIMFFSLVVLLISLPVIMYYDNLNMKFHQCQRTNETREGYYIQNIYGAKGTIIVSYPVPYTEYKYACDDKSRWR